MARAKKTEHRRSGCGLVAAIMQIGSSKQRKKLPSTNPSQDSKAISVAFQSGFHTSISVKKPPANVTEKPFKKQVFIRRMSSKFGKTNQDSRAQNPSVSFVTKSMNPSQIVNLDYTQRLRREPTFSSSELSVKLHRKSSANGMLYQASQSSVMLVGHLGNLKPRGKERKASVLKDSKVIPGGNGGGTSRMGGSIVKKSGELRHHSGKLLTDSAKKADPEEIKSIGNEMYKKGNFEEALAFYDRAISLDSNKASFYSNKSAALMSLGRLMEAVFAGLEAIKIEPTYHNAHYRLARLYLRLGDAEKAMYHLNHSGQKASSKDIHEAEALQTHLGRCSGARKRRDWDALLNETQVAISMGADSAPQIYAMQAEALLKLRKHDEAYLVVQKIPDFGIDHNLIFLGPSITANLLMVKSQVFVGVGRFEDALTAARVAQRLKNLSVEIKAIVTRVDAISQARKDGNYLFDSSRFEEAAAVYSAALELEPYNSILLCNRAACRSKLGLLEKAIEDCSLALILRPSYSKARLRRADSYAKLGSWGAALQDYEVLMQEIPGDEKVSAAYEEAKKEAESVQNFDNGKLKGGLNSDLSYDHSVRITSAAEFYGNGSSFKFATGIDIRQEANFVGGQFGSPAF